MDSLEDDGLGIDPEIDEEEGGEQLQQANGYAVSPPEDNEETIWRRLDLNDKFEKVMELLNQGKRRWDDSSRSPNIPILEEYMKEGLTARDPRDSKGSTALHILARDYQKKYSSIEKKILMSVITFLLAHMDKAASSTEASPGIREEPILNVAMEYGNDEFIQCVKDCQPGGFPDLLHIKDEEGKNFIHRVFFLPAQAMYNTSNNNTARSIKDDRNNAMKRAIRFVPEAKPETLAAKDADGNTPIHYAMEYRQCYGRNSKYIRIFQEMVEKSDKFLKGNNAFNNEEESPLLYSLRTEKEYKSTTQYKKTQKPKNDAAPQHQANDPAHRKMKQIEGGDFEDNSPAAAATPRNTTKNAAYGRNDDASEGPDSGKPMTSQTSPTQGGVIGDDCVNEIRKFLRLHYIRTRSDSEARDLIDGKDISDKNLYFDASGHKGADQLIELINRMSVGGFGDTLAYVYIPTVQHSPDSKPTAKISNKSHPMNQGVARQKTLTENPNIGRSSLIGVFDKLHELGVKSILRLQVEDRESPSHTDAAIERALQGRDSVSDEKSRGPISVETWDWRKPDLSIDVISFAAPTVEHVNLYWSGNPAVLRGWGCAEGIPRLYFSSQKLKTVTIYAAPGIETRERMTKMLERFKEDVRKRVEEMKETDANAIDTTKNGKEKKDLIKINEFYRMSGLFTKADLNEEKNNATRSKVESEEQHKWVKQMEDFRTALNSIHRALENRNFKLESIKRVKVALIDDGVDASSLDKYNDIVIVTGRSYYPRDVNGESPWHRSSCGHGTIMANMILRINPWVYLHVMKIQDGLSNDGSRTIFAESAARAIRGAIHRDVDIISMSWTVKQKIASIVTNTTSHQPSSTGEPHGIKELREAIRAAVDAKILMFCSASDDIQAEAMDFWPYRGAPDYIFRIGAALAQGQRDPHTEDNKNINYFFPGNKVAEAWNPRSAETVKYHDGSSVSTALAAGLASLIIYCANIMGTYHGAKIPPQGPSSPEKVPDISGKTRFEGFAKELRKRDKMKRAFDNIESENWDRKKFLPVWRTFESITNNINEMNKLEDKVQQLDKLVSDLCSRF
ncbi:hypothetical protein V8C37DRAFT_161785 [Trichoderma ceciliae]